MRDTELYAQILGVRSPWEVTSVDLRLEAGEVEVDVVHASPESLRCPKCGGPAKRHDARRRRWRHLPTCQYKTILTADVPRVKCAEHGVLTIEAPWSVPNSGFTALMEAMIIDWLREATILAVARRLGLSWDQVAGVMERAVKRGLTRRSLEPAKRLGVDETSFQKRHEYVTVVADLDAGVVHHVADGRGMAGLDEYYQSLDSTALAAIETVAMDMWPPFVVSTYKALKGAAEIVAFDKFHIAMHFGKAIDEVRREEHRELMGRDDESLKGTMYLWRRNPSSLTESQFERMAGLKQIAKKTARAWESREIFMGVWDCEDRDDAENYLRAWCQGAIRSRLKPIKRVARMIRRHLDGVLTAVVQRVTNARLEGINTVIQWIKRSARGFRNRERFRQAIYFHLGGLDLYPDALFHSNS